MSDTLFTTNEPYAEEIADLVEIGMLNEVGIDYEAAWGYARQEDNGHIAARKNDDLVVLDKVDVMALIDAALGIGGDDEEPT